MNLHVQTCQTALERQKLSCMYLAQKVWLFNIFSIIMIIVTLLRLIFYHHFYQYH